MKMEFTKWIFDIWVNQKALNYLDHKNLKNFTSRGTTPDHVLEQNQTSYSKYWNLNQVKIDFCFIKK